ncbi:MAG: hypothetical protein QNJ29_10385 [Rhizobiaceae bacterium]|nr:hypothetical protein [Rhizobiaceae bacterium]
MRIIEIEHTSSVLNKGISKTVADGVGDSFQRLKFSGSNLIISVENSIRMHKSEVEGSRTIIGKIIGLFSKGPDPDNIRIDGLRLFQCFEIADEEPPIPIHVGKTYQVDLISLEFMISKVKKITENQQ